MSTPVFAFYDETPEIPRDQSLLDQWARSWRYYGWEPVLLGREHALANDPDYCAAVLASKELKRGCPTGYNNATHLRWAAHPGGLMVDYDVICNGFEPSDMRDLIVEHGVDSPIFLNACVCCCAVYAEPAARDLMKLAISSHAREVDSEEGKRRKFGGELAYVAHDQAIFARKEHWWIYPPKSYVVEYTDHGWKQACLIHYCNAKTPSPRGLAVKISGLEALK